MSSAGAAVSEPDTGRATTLLLVRHARTSSGDARRICGGDAAGPPLCEAGTAEAHRLAALLSGAAAERFGPVSAVISSPLVRARETAAIVGDRLDLPVGEDAGWSELRMGDWHGLTYAEIADGWPEQFRAWQASTTVIPPRAESLAQLADRVMAATGRTVDGHRGRTVAVVTHTGPIRAVVAATLDAGPSAFWRLALDPASVTVVRRWCDGGSEISAVNLTGDRLP